MYQEDSRLDGESLPFQRDLRMNFGHGVVLKRGQLRYGRYFGNVDVAMRDEVGVDLVADLARKIEKTCRSSRGDICF